jgi:glycosyltransferase involved in cell wall biosynthesis
MSTSVAADASPKVTVILPTYNRLQFLRTAVASVLAQTYRNWSLIIADDGSDDETRAHLAMLEKMPQVKVVWLTHAGNPARTRNAALREADGELVAFLDSDDVWMPTKLESQVRTLSEHRECRWCYTAFLRVDEQGRPLAAERNRRWTPFAGEILGPLISTAASLRTPSVLAERSLVAQVGGFDETLCAAEDYDLWMRLALASPVALVDEQLVHVRVHAANQSSHSWPAPFVGREESLRKLHRRVPEQYREALRRARMHNAIQLARSYVQRSDRRNALRTLYRSSGFSWRYPRWWWESCMTLTHLR